MREVFKYEKGYWYPHMKPRDVEIWERFIAKFPDAYKSCRYDFAVGDTPPFSTDMDHGNGANMDELYKLKIDVVAQDDIGLDIIEIKPSAGASTIGQVKGYKALFIRDENPSENVGMCIITDEEKPNMRYLCELEGVKLYVV